LGRQEPSNDEHPSCIKTIANNVRTFSFFFWSGIDWPIIIFLKNIERVPIEAPLGTTIQIIKTNMLPMAHLFTLYMRQLNFGQTIWDKTGVLFRMSWGTS
jgi:hypothetical protein